jgi:hypothetical protein
MRSKSAEPDGTALAGTLDHKQTVVDLSGLADELSQVLEPGKDTDVGWLVDDGLDAESPPFFQVLLDAAVLVGEVHVHFGARREHPLAVGLADRASELAGEHHRHLLGPTDADVVSHEGLEEAPRPARVVEDEGARHLDLAHRQLPEVARTPVVIGERGRDHRAPPVEEALDVRRPEAVADGLEGDRVLARGEAVRELAEGDAGVTRLALGPLVAVQPYLGRVGEVGARS